MFTESGGPFNTDSIPGSASCSARIVSSDGEKSCLASDPFIRVAWDNRLLPADFDDEESTERFRLGTGERALESGRERSSDTVESDGVKDPRRSTGDIDDKLLDIKGDDASEVCEAVSEMGLVVR